MVNKINHQIYLKLSDMICLAINYCLLQKYPDIKPFKIGYFPIPLCRVLLLKEIDTV